MEISNYRLKNFKAIKSLFESYELIQSVFSKPTLEGPRNNKVKVIPNKILNEKFDTLNFFIILIDNFKNTLNLQFK